MRDSDMIRQKSPLNLLTILEILLFIVMQLSFFAVSFYRWDFTFLPDWKIILLCLLSLAAYNHFSLLKEALASKNIKRNLLAFALIFSLLLVTRVAQFKYSRAALNSDRQVTSLMTLHISEHKSRPIYFYGQLYQGCLSSYFYAAVYKLVPDLQIAITLANLIIFALAILFAYMLISKFVAVPPVYYFSFMASLFASLYYISLDTTRGFQLWALLFFLMLYFCYQAIFEKKNCFLVCGFLGGLLFYQYQPSAIIIFFLLLAVLWQKKSLPAALAIGLGFVAGSFPHLLSEVQTNFYNTRFLFSKGEAREIALKNFLPIFFFPAHYFNNIVLPQISAYLFDLLFVGGYGYCLYKFLKTKLGRYLWLPAIYMLISIGLFLSGIVPQESRYRAHFVVYSILAAQFMTLPFSWQRVFGSKTVKALFVIALCLFNGIAIADFVKKRKESHWENRAAIEKILSLDEPVILGNYWDTMRFAPFAEDRKIIMTTPSLKDPNVFNSNTIKYLPNTLALAEDWDSSRNAMLIRANAYKYVARFLGLLGVNCKTAELNDNLLLVYDFSKKLSLELVAVLTASKLKNYADIAAFIPAPGRIRSISLKGGILHLEADLTDGQREFSPFHKIVLKQPSWPLQVEIPFEFRGGVMDWRMPAGVLLPGGKCSVAITFLNFPLLEQEMEIRVAPGAEPVPAEKIAFSSLALQKNFPVWDTAVGGERKIAGIPLTNGFSCLVLAKEAEAVQLTLYSLLDFKTPDWYNRYQQELLVTQNGKMMKFPLRFGRNLVDLPVRSGDRITLATRYASFFRNQAQGSAAIESLEFINTGAMLQELSLKVRQQREPISLLPQVAAAAANGSVHK